MFIITEDGKRVQIESPYSDDDDEMYSGIQRVGLFSDNVRMKRQVVMYAWKAHRPWMADGGEDECVAESKLKDMRPTQDEMLKFASQSGLTRFDYITVEIRYVIDFDQSEYFEDGE